MSDAMAVPNPDSIGAYVYAGVFATLTAATAAWARRAASRAKDNRDQLRVQTVDGETSAGKTLAKIEVQMDNAADDAKETRAALQQLVGRIDGLTVSFAEYKGQQSGELVAMRRDVDRLMQKVFNGG